MRFKNWLMSACLLFSLSVFPQSGISVKNVAKAGLLQNQFQGESLGRIKVLKIKGELNKHDLKFINNELHVTDLDLSESTFDSSIAKKGHLPGFIFEKLNSSLQRIVLPSNIEHLEDNAFMGMSCLESLVTRHPIKSVGKNAFRDCTRLNIIGTEFNQAIAIDDFAFYNCSSIQRIELSRELTKLGLKVFWGCSSLKEVVIDEKNKSLLFIPEGAFYGCKSLESVDIPVLVKSIDRLSFLGCNALSTIHLRTIIPPMLADKAFNEELPSMNVFVSDRSFSLYKKSSSWRRFRNYLVSNKSEKIYEKKEEPEKIRPTVVPESTLAASKIDSTAEQKSEPEKNKEAVLTASLVPREKKQSPKMESVKAEGKHTVPEVKEEKKVVVEQTKPVVVAKEKQKESVPVKQETKPVVVEKTSFEDLLRQHTTLQETKPETYFGSPVINHAVTSLELYMRNGMVHVEAPAKIKQLTIIDSKGRTIYATRVTDVLYSTSVNQASIKLIRAVYENGIETKRF